MIATHRSPEQVPLFRARVFTWATTALLGSMAFSTVEAQTIRAYTFVPPGEGAWIAMTELAMPEPGPYEVLVDVRAASLNRRDLSIANSGRYRGGDAVGTVALSDGAGEVVAIGPSVTRFRVQGIPAGTSVSVPSVGSRADFEAMNRFIGEHQLRPVIDRVFEFEDAAAAFDYMDSNLHFGTLRSSSRCSSPYHQSNAENKERFAIQPPGDCSEAGSARRGTNGL